MMRVIASILSFAIIITAATLGISRNALAFRIDNFVRTGNQYLVAGPDLRAEDYVALSRFDLVVLPAEAQNFNPDAAEALKRLNPDILILAYVPTVSYNDQYWNDALHVRLRDALTPTMELRNRYGSQISIWPQTRAYNIASADYRAALSNYIEQQIWRSSYWDGIFLDEVSASISWVGTTDIDLDGAQDDSRVADDAWKQGYAALFADVRGRLGDNAILITNGSSDNALQSHVNGRMFESFPTPWEGAGRWQDTMSRLLRTQSIVAKPDVFFVNGNTGDTGTIDYARMRYGLTSAMLGGAFFGYDRGEQSHAQLWTFDEFETFLGRVVDVPKDELNGRTSLASTQIYPSVWSREFQEGRILVNATDTAHTIALGEDFEKINGTQDRTVNDGRIVNEVTMAPQDGLVLMRPIESLKRASFTNGSFVRVFNARGERARTGFFAYTGATLGGEHIARADLDGDGTLEIISAGRSQVRVHDSAGRMLRAFFPYTEHYQSGIYVAVGDLDGDGRAEIVTGTKQGGGPHVRIFDSDGRLKSPGFFAYDERFRGGVRVALGDVNGDGTLEIITGAGAGGSPHVRVFDLSGHILGQFMAYDQRARGGVSVAAGDVTGDGVADIVTGSGAGARALVRIYNIRGEQIISEFEALSARRGVDVAVEDLDGDGRAEILALTTDVFTLSAVQ